MFDDDGEATNYNAHPFYHGAPWYDWSYVCYNILNRDGTSRIEYYPSKILGLIKYENEVQAVIQCSVKAIAWTMVEQSFVCPFELCSDVGKEQIVPLLSLTDPVFVVVKDYGANDNKYMLILPKRQLSGYFARFVSTVCEACG